VVELVIALRSATAVRASIKSRFLTATLQDLRRPITGLLDDTATKISARPFRLHEESAPTGRQRELTPGGGQCFRQGIFMDNADSP
jgi:hypothetical protein